MKGINMKAPALQEIYTQKLYQHKLHYFRTYEFHKKKLQKIREERKTHLAFDQHRISHIETIKDSKNKSFAHKFNEQCQEINKSNIKFLGKLQRIKPVHRYTSHSQYQRQSSQKQHNSTTAFINPYMKKRIIQTEKQNSRIFNKMRSLSSSLNQDKMLRDYTKSQKIKSRITKYANQGNKILLKYLFLQNRSEKYLHLNKTALSNSTERNNICEEGQENIKARKNYTSHYNKEEILKHKIDSADVDIKKMKKIFKDQNEEEQNNEENKGKGFFTTEPQKVRKNKYKNQRRIKI